ncbi:hypothetical protein [Sphaerisporangium fuscum]|uniref:hypothetical protein n=1 Tax=Sphaerisporangium fuscum TaxID=2835868 RepID=UPI001BDCF727|nr:hypothetical protein [Sphaerisporangium fuscum]
MGGRVNGSWQTTALHVDGRGRSACFVYPHRTPIFEVSAGNSIVKVTLHANRVDYASLLFARELAEQARAFAEEVERLHHIQNTRKTRREESRA